MIKNPDSNEICDILNTSKTIAVVGISSNSSRMSRIIADYLISKGYDVIGINPGMPAIDGIEVYSKLIDVPKEIDIVNVFRNSDNIGEIIPDVIEKKPKVLWLQLGIRNDTAVLPAFENGIKIIQDTCIKVQHSMC